MVSFRRKPVLASMVAIGGGRPFVVAWRCARCPAVSGTCICSSRRGVAGEICWFYVYWRRDRVGLYIGFVYSEYVEGIVMIQKIVEYSNVVQFDVS